MCGCSWYGPLSSVTAYAYDGSYNELSALRPKLRTATHTAQDACHVTARQYRPSWSADTTRGWHPEFTGYSRRQPLSEAGCC